MFLLPVAAREVREASRQSRTYLWRAATAAVALAVMAFIAWVDRYSTTRGHDLFVAVSTIAFIYCLVAGVVRTADTLAAEKRDNTLGLLFLTDLKGWDIILGKLLSSSVNCLFGLLALIPMLAIPMLMGGVRMTEFLRVILSLVVTLLLSISWGFLISSLFRLSVVTISAGLAVVIITAGGLPLLAVLLAEEFHFNFLAAAVFVFSPTHCHMFSFDVSAPAFLHHYWTSIAINFAIALINLRLAIFFLPRFWQEVPKNKNTETWRNRIRALRFGKSKAKNRLRKRLLDRNPFFWLANREQVSSVGLMITCVVILSVALAAGIAASRNAWRGVQQIMILWMLGLILIHALIAFRMAMSATYRLAEDRRSGALELLLGTEVSIRQILRGYWMALGRQFFGPALIVIFGGAFGLSMMLLMFSDMLESKTGNIVAALIEVLASLFRPGGNSEKGLLFSVAVSIQLMAALNWIAVIWVGMWLGLREKRPGVATWVTLSLVYIPPWVLLIAGLITYLEMGLGQNIPGDRGVLITLSIAWILGASNVVLLSFWARRNLRARFREAAADRYMGPRRFAWPKLRRIAIRFAVAGACIVALLYVARLIVDRRGDKAWAQALAAYPNFTLAEPAETATPIAADQNLGAAPFFRAFTASGSARKIITWNLSSVTRSGYEGENLIWEWSQRRRMNLPHVEDTYIERKILKESSDTPGASVLDALSVYDERFEELHEEALNRPLLRYPAKSPSQLQNQNHFVMYPESDIRTPLRQLIETLALRASANLANGSFTNTDDIMLALRLADGVKDLPQSLLQYYQDVLSCVQPIYDGLTRGAFKNDDLQKIQKHFASLDLWRDFERNRSAYLRQVLNDSESIALSTRLPHRNWVERQAPTGFRRKWQADTLRWGMTTLPKVADTTTHRIDPVALRDFQRSRPTPPTPDRYPDEIHIAVRSLAFTQTTTDQIVIACALERFRNDHGNLPAKLDDLVPTYLTAVPHDIFNGQPLHYSVNADGRNYIIYSVGSDAIDNNGIPAAMPGAWMFWQDQPNTDWVWNSSATDPVSHPRQKRKATRK